MAWVSFVKSQLVEGKAEAVLGMRWSWESVGWHIDLAFSLTEVVK